MTTRTRRAWQWSTSCSREESSAPSPDAMGRYFKMEDGTRVQVVGIAEDGKYYQTDRRSKAGDVSAVPAIAQQPDMPGGALRPRPAATGGGDPQHAARDLDASLPLNIQTWTQGLDIALFPSHVATVSLGVLGMMGAMLSITGIFGMAAYSVSKRLREIGIRIALGAQRKEVLQAAFGRAFKLLAIGSAAGLSWEFWPPECSPTSCIRPLPAIRWCWRALFSPCRCWACLPRGFLRNVRCRLIL